MNHPIMHLHPLKRLLFPLETINVLQVHFPLLAPKQQLAALLRMEMAQFETRKLLWYAKVNEFS